MNPVVGLDVANGESQVQAFLDKGKPYRKSFSIRHNLEGLGKLLEVPERNRTSNRRTPTFGCFGIYRTLSHPSCSVFRRTKLCLYYRESTYFS